MVPIVQETENPARKSGCHIYSLKIANLEIDLLYSYDIRK